MSAVLGLGTVSYVIVGKALPCLDLGFSWLVCANTVGEGSVVSTALAGSSSVRLPGAARVEHQAGGVTSDGTVSLTAL